MAIGTQNWDLSTLLNGSGHEAELLLSNISLNPMSRDDYEFTNNEIMDASNQIRSVGLTQRLVVERIGGGYTLIGPLLPYLALLSMDAGPVSCIVRRGDTPQAQELLSIQLNSAYSGLSPLVYSRLIARLNNLYPVIKSISSIHIGVKREWIANVLGISSSAVLRYSYISKVPVALQLRCNNPQFPYLCLREVQHLTPSQQHQLLDDLIHYELHSRYQTISASEFAQMIQNAAKSAILGDSPVDAAVVNHQDSGISSSYNSVSNDRYTAHNDHPHVTDTLARMPILDDALTEQYYSNLRDTFEEQYEDDLANNKDSAMMQIARKDGYYIPDQTLKDISYQLYCLSQMRLTSGQRLLDYACLRSILESVSTIYSQFS